MHNNITRFLYGSQGMQHLHDTSTTNVHAMDPLSYQTELIHFTKPPRWKGGAGGGDSSCEGGISAPRNRPPFFKTQWTYIYRFYSTLFEGAREKFWFYTPFFKIFN